MNPENNTPTIDIVTPFVEKKSVKVILIIWIIISAILATLLILVDAVGVLFSPLFGGSVSLFTIVTPIILIIIQIAFFIVARSILKKDQLMTKTRNVSILYLLIILIPLVYGFGRFYFSFSNVIENVVGLPCSDSVTAPIMNLGKNYLVNNKSESYFRIQGCIFYSRGGNGFELGSAKLKDANAGSFVAISEDYGKDSEHAYYKNFLLKNVDSETFVYKDGVARDAKHVVMGATVISGSDPQTFEFVGNKASDFNQRTVFYKDRNTLYMTGDPFADESYYSVRIKDPNSFRKLGRDYFADNQAVYWSVSVIDGADPATFKVINLPDGVKDYNAFSGGADFASDKDHVYYHDMMLLGADPKTFSSAQYGGTAQYYGFDSRYCYSISKGVTDVNGNLCKIIDWNPVVKKVIPTQSQTQTSPSVLNSTLDTKDYIDTKNGFSITPPKGWIVDNSGAHNSVVNFMNGSDVIDVAVGTTTQDQDEYAKSLISRLKSLPLHYFLDDKMVDLGGVHARMANLIYPGKGATMHMAIVIVVKDGKSYVIASQTLDQNWKSQSSVIGASLLSFKFN